MPLETIAINFRGRQLPFLFPDSDNMRDHLADIFSGKEYALPLLPPDYQIQSIIDVGANVGATAMWWYNWAPPEARLICYEPARENFECLTHNLKPFPNAEVHHWGLYSADKQATLHLGASQCMQHSIIPSHETGTQTETITLKRASAEFDRLGLSRVSILKIDTEGCELDILRDLGPERLARVDILYLEWHSDEDRRAIDALLHDHFLLCYAGVRVPHRGNAGYLSRPLAARVPLIAAQRIAPSED